MEVSVVYTPSTCWAASSPPSCRLIVHLRMIRRNEWSRSFPSDTYVHTLIHPNIRIHTSIFIHICLRTYVLPYMFLHTPIYILIHTYYSYMYIHISTLLYVSCLASEVVLRRQPEEKRRHASPGPRLLWRALLLFDPFSCEGRWRSLTCTYVCIFYLSFSPSFSLLLGSHRLSEKPWWCPSCASDRLGLLSGDF